MSGCVAWTLVSVAHVTTKWTYGTLAIGAFIRLFILSVHWCDDARCARGVFVFAKTMTCEIVDFNMNNNCCNKQLKRLRIQTASNEFV